MRSAAVRRVAPATSPACATPDRDRLAERIDAALPQTQCRRCGYADCRHYAQAIAAGAAEIDRCPPGGAEGVRRLAAITGGAPRPLAVECGAEGPRALAVIDEAGCIGCTLCIQACPIDCIVGTSKAMHTVIDAQCTGCELCVPACPVDCIQMRPVTGECSGWAAWSAAQAEAARARHEQRRRRLQRQADEDDERLRAAVARKAASTQTQTPCPPGSAAGADIGQAAVADPRRATVAAALARARERLRALPADEG